MAYFLRTSLLLAVALTTSAQTTCTNYGQLNSTRACICPPGLGGSNCSQPACGGNIFQGTQRLLTQNNVTSCSCESGWVGAGCNVCSASNACASGFAAVSSSTPVSSSGLGSDGQNNSLTCNTSPRVYASGEMSCQVLNPTLQALFPLRADLNILRTIDPSLSPIPNVTSFGSSGSAYAQLIYAGVEQFYCSANGCSQTVQSDQSSVLSCGSLQCTCVRGTAFCGQNAATDLTNTINALGGTLEIDCHPATSPGNATCSFKQQVLQQLFGQDGLSLSSCAFGECVRQSVIDVGGSNSTTGGTESTGKSLSGGVIAGLAVVGALLLMAIVAIVCGWLLQRRARRQPVTKAPSTSYTLSWDSVSYIVQVNHPSPFGRLLNRKTHQNDFASSDKTVLDRVSGQVSSGQLMAIMGPSGAGKTTLIEILSGKRKVGRTTGDVLVSPGAGARIGFVSQDDVLPPYLTVRETLLFAARLRLPENMSDTEKQARVQTVLESLGLTAIAESRIGNIERRGISGGEARRVAIGIELVAQPQILILDEPTSGLDSVSASKVASVLHKVAHDSDNPTAVIASIHQPGSKLYQMFDLVMVLSHGRSLYTGPGGMQPAEYFARHGYTCPAGYNVADHLLDIASDPSPGLFQIPQRDVSSSGSRSSSDQEKLGPRGKSDVEYGGTAPASRLQAQQRSNFGYATTALSQFQYISGREWKNLKRDKSLFLSHIGVSCVLGVFVGGLYFKTDDTIAGFQSTVGSLFFLGSLVAFSSLSALYNLVEVRALFVRERAASFYSPVAWLLARFLFDVIPLRIIPTIIVSTITYWMAGLSASAAVFFKFLLALVLYSLCMTLWNFLLACVFRNGGIAILLSALSALYQMTFAGFFVHLGDIPPVLRWLQWLDPLKYCLEALSVNEVGSGRMIRDTLEGVPVNVSASLIMNLLFGFGANNYYRDILVLFAFIAGFGLGVIAIVFLRLKERR